MNTLHFSFGLGALTSPALLAVLSADLYGVAYFVTATGAILNAGVALAVLAPTRPRPGEKEEASCCTQVAGAYLDPVLVTGMLLFFCYSGMEVGFGTWIFTYAVDSGVAERSRAALLTSLFWGFLTIGRLIAIPLAIYFTPLQLALGDVTLGGFFLFIFLVTNSWTMTVLATSCFGLALASLFASMLTAVQARCGDSADSTTSLIFVAASVGEMSLPVVIGYAMGGTVKALPVILLPMTVVLGGLLLVLKRQPMIGEQQAYDGLSGAEERESVDRNVDDTLDDTLEESSPVLPALHQQGVELQEMTSSIRTREGEGGVI